ncbi:MAG TPA: inositol monophosphatase family protein [Gammaproteobacteria bacterium]|nr:inositol monophosphatase family protein [Gammaproteobacteria bacterium]HRP86665.1 inositol monophosphatase family protein [Gammaproteobacteria bacterium]
MHPILNIGVRAARRAGDLIVRHINQLDAIRVDSKGRNDFVSEVDRMAEQDIIRTVQRSYPDHAFLAEESGASGDAEYVWIIDPLDGTTNFLHGFPVFCVSIAVMHRGRLEHGVIFDPLRNELFTASRGAGASVDGRKMRVSDTRLLEKSLLGTGYPYKPESDWLDPYMDMLKSAIRETSGVRRPGAAALDLAYVAAGRLDGFWEIGLNIWDIAAGALMIQECGGIVTDLAGRDGWQQSGNVVAGNPKIHEALLKLIEPHLTQDLKR